MDRRQALARGDSLPDRTTGAALFADISGFTPLTEALANELGPRRGAEELTRQLNLIYGDLIAEAERYRGSVISFSGDAITCWFDQDQGRRAAACALAMQQVMSQLATITTPSGTTISLAIKVAVAAGPVRRFRIGDPAIQYLDALAGATLERLAAAEHAAEKDEVSLSAEVVARLGDSALIREWRQAEETGLRVAILDGLTQPVADDPWPHLPSDALAEEQVRPWLLPGMYERERTGQEQFLAELRPAVALFVRFGGIDYDADEAAGEKLDSFIRWAQNVIKSFDGSLLQLTIGDKGSYFYAAFGAPVAHDDDADRAVAAGLALRKPDLGYITGVHIGISQGRMRAGPYGGETRRTYGVLGEEVNLAARLMSRAEAGQILISQRVADLVGKRYALHSIGAIAVKGKQEPALISEVLGPLAIQQAATLYSHALVGRETELGELLSWLGLARTGRGQIVRLEGPAGIGKSHLVAEFATRALMQGFRVAAGTCQSTTQATYYAPWRQVIRALLELGDEPVTTESAIARQVAAVEDYVAQTNRDWLLRLPLLAKDLLGLPVDDNPTTAAFEPKLRQSALFDLVVEMMERWAGTRPLLVLVDDVHWMDEASQGLTLALGRAIAEMPILLLLAQRPSLEDRPIAPELEPLAFYHRFSLGELPLQGIAALVASRLGGPPNPLSLSLIQAETQGNPFFAEEVVGALRESGHLAPRENGQWYLSERIFTALQQANYLVREEGHWVLAPQASLSTLDLGLPDSIQGVVLSRIDRLMDEDRLTLKVASVIGRIFELDLTAYAHPSQPDADTLLEQVNRLEERDFTHPVSPLSRDAPAERLYIFKHNVTREVAYDTLLFDQRRRLHRAVGEALERIAPESVPQLAYHTYIAEDWGRALHYQIAAGEQAQKLFANGEAIEHFRKALRCADNLPPGDDTLYERRQIHASLGELLTTTGQYDLALHHLQEALRLSEALGDGEAQARACRWIAYAHELRSEYSLALDWIQRGQQALGAQETAAQAELLAIAGLIHTRQGNHERALEQCEASVRIAARLKNAPAMAFAHNSRGIAFILRGDSTAAIQEFHQALELYQQTSNIHGQAKAYNQIANAHFNLSQWPAADRAYRQAREIFAQTGDIHWLAVTNNNLGGLALNQGRLDDALAFYREGLRALEQIGASLWLLGVFNMNLGATWLRRGDLGAARKHLGLSQENFARAQARDYLPELHRHFAEAALLAGELDEAQAQGQQALALARELNMRGEEGTSLGVLGEVGMARGDLAQAESALAESVSLLESLGQEYESARSWLSLAKVYLSLKQAEQGLAALDRCQPTFERLEAALDLESARRVREQLTRSE
jgi:predicted ATPase/class 3 adenylate cyclase